MNLSDLKKNLQQLADRPIQVRCVKLKSHRQQQIDQLRQTAPKYPAQLTGIRTKRLWGCSFSSDDVLANTTGITYAKYVILQVTTTNGMVFESDPTNVPEKIAATYIQQHLPVSVHVDGQGHSYVVVEELPPFQASQLFS